MGRQTRASMSSRRTAEHDSTMVSLSDEDTILNHIDSFCARVKQSLDIIKTLSQFQK